MEVFYTDERNVQLVLALLKAHGIRKVVASPGATNVTVVASMQHDSYFEMYSCVDERSAAYMACGLSEESGEPVVLSCTGATSSRNYMPGLTEAFYRKLPILAITSTMDTSRIGHLFAQTTDRSAPPKDVVKYSVCLQTIKDANDEWDCEIKANNAMLELTRNGGGPVHINLTTCGSRKYLVKELPVTRSIKRVCQDGELPDFPLGKIGIFVGSHSKWSKEQEETLDRFCASRNAVVFCDHTSNYKGKYRFLSSLIASQDNYISDIYQLDLLIHIGDISGDYYSFGCLKAKKVWRVSKDGEIRDFFHKLQYVFEMPEEKFFAFYTKTDISSSDNYLISCKDEYNKILNKLPDLPFSNLYIASKLSSCIPENSVLHLGILNSLRAWNFFEIPHTVLSYSNVGGFGIDGIISTLIGASLADKSKNYYAVIGDLAFFYDLNALGNHHIGNNIRILLVNNGRGIEFRNYNHAASVFGEETDKYIAAAGHFGNKSSLLVKNYAENLGFEYLTASNKKDFEEVYKSFLVQETLKPIIFEVFTNEKDESNALRMINNIEINRLSRTKKTLKESIRYLVGNEILQAVKNIIK